MIITPNELIKNMNDYQLIDVRQPSEFVICKIDGSVNIPLDQLLNRLDEINRDKIIIMICHHGVRSLNAAMLLKSVGFNNVLSLSGGVEKWAIEIDKTMKRY